MSRLLVAYATTEGFTREIADHVADLARARGVEVTTFDVAHGPHDTLPQTYAGAIVAASVHMGRHQPRMVEFVRDHRELLRAVPAAFLSISLASAVHTESGDADAVGFVADFVDRTGWRPPQIGLVAGRLAFREYGAIKRFVMQRIAEGSGVRLDTDYTDWAALDGFVSELIDGLAPRGAT